MKASERKALFDMATRVANGNNFYLSHVLESLVEQRKMEMRSAKGKSKGSGKEKRTDRRE